MLELYKRIKSRREELKISQDELAKKLGYRSRSSINKIEKGENDIPQSKIFAFAVALNTTPEYLMGWDNKKNRQEIFSDDESKLLDGYRALDDSKRQTLFSMLAFLSSSQGSGVGTIVQNNTGNNSFLAVGNGNNYINTAT